MLRVLVLDGWQRSTLAVVRSLGEKGVFVVVGEDRFPNLASSSKHCKSTFHYSSPLNKPAKFIRELAAELESRKYDVLLPMTDITCGLLMENYDLLSPLTSIPLPERIDYKRAIDKSFLVKKCQEMGLPTPKTFFINTIQDIEKYKDEFEFPIVLKPGQSKYLTDNGWVETGVDYALNYEELAKKLNNYDNSIPLPMIQERISGPGEGAFLLFCRGKARAVFFHKRLREKPPSGGVSVLRESIEIHHGMRDYAINILEALNWHGVAMAEFKIDNRDNLPKIMEINARFWGSLQLSIDSGIDFPYMLVKMCVDKDVEPVFDYRTGVKVRWFMGDFDHLLLRLLKSDTELRLPQNSPGKFRTLLEFIKFFDVGLKYEIIKLSDIKPFFAEIKEWFRHLLGKKK